MTDAPSGTPLISDLALGISLLSAVGWIATALMARARGWLQAIDGRPSGGEGR